MHIDLSKQILDPFDRPVRRQLETGELIDTYVADAIYAAVTATTGNEGQIPAHNRALMYQVAKMAAWYPGKKVKGEDGEPVDAPPVVQFDFEHVRIIRERSHVVNMPVVHGFLIEYMDELWSQMGKHQVNTQTEIKG
jgi:hypothetical protein